MPSDHLFGSARAYRYGGGPTWLERTRVEGVLTGFFEPRAYSPRDYDSYACSVDRDINAHLIERRMRSPHASEPPLTDLIRTASLRQQGWMEWKAALADGIAVGTAFVSPDEALRAARVAARVWTLRVNPMPRMAATTKTDLAAGLLRGAAGLTLQEIASRLGVSVGCVHGAVRRHAERLQTPGLYDDVVARALQGAVRRSLRLRGHPLSVLPVVGDGGGGRRVVR